MSADSSNNIIYPLNMPTNTSYIQTNPLNRHTDHFNSITYPLYGTNPNNPSNAPIKSLIYLINWPIDHCNSLKYPLNMPTDTSTSHIHPLNRPFDAFNSLKYILNRHTYPS